MAKKSVNANEKSPKLTVPEVISYCKNELGITFNLICSAEVLLTNIFRRLRSGTL